DGALTAYQPKDPFKFKDGDAFRPVCPFFELHAEWDIDGEVSTGLLTKDVLDRLNVPLDALQWRIKVANLKAFHLTKSPGDRIEASIKISGGTHVRQELHGKSPKSDRALVPEGRHILLGSAQVTRPTDEFPELRLRFTPPPGKVYAPRDIAKRLGNLQQPA